jgi:segregation and condensation protein B
MEEQEKPEEQGAPTVEPTDERAEEPVQHPAASADAGASGEDAAAVEPLSDAESQAALAEELPVLPPQEIRAIVEALVFASPQPVTARELNQVLSGVAKEDWLAAIEELKAEYARAGRGLQLVEVASGYQITTRPEYNDWVRELLSPKVPTRLSIQALETLAVIAYKQPVTLPEIIELRGVKSGGVLKTLLEKRLIRITGRKEVVGRPMLYGTTKEFLLHFGLKDLSELPKIEEFAQVLGEEVDIDGLKKAIEAPRPVEVPLSEDAGSEEAESEPSPGPESDVSASDPTDDAPSEDE